MTTHAQGRRVLRSRRGAAVLSAGLLTLAVGVPVAASGQGTEGGAAAVTPIALQQLSGPAPFPDDVSLQVKRKLPGQGTDVINVKDAGRVVTARLVLQPGATFPWHTHPGPVIVTVQQGDLVYQQASDCIERSYGTNEAFVDPGPKVHTAWNPGEAETVLVATFYGVKRDAEGNYPLTIPEQPQVELCG